MHWIDWTIVAIVTALLVSVGFYTMRFNRSVADFLSANRCAGRYLLSISKGIAGLGAISVVANFELYYNGGFSAGWWQMTVWPVWLFVSLSGWVVYRYRETRAMTIAQFFEIRYSRNFRVFCGILAWASGVINMGIFPAVTANFFIYFCNLPHSFSFIGIECSTFATLMLLNLALALWFTLSGGMIVMMVTNFLQGLFCYTGFVVILFAMFYKFDWSQIVAALKTAPPDASLVNPFKISNIEGFNLSYFLIVAFGTVYTWMAWQGLQGYNSAAKNAHEAKMSGIISIWRELILMLLLMLMPVCAYTLLHHPAFAAQAQAVRQAIAGIADPQLQKQMTVPLALTQILPVGIMGLFVAIMVAAATCNDDAYLHSWGSIFVQDVILPFRKKGFTTKQHITLLRLSILLVAIIIFLFSLLFKQTDYIIMYMLLTAAIYLGGAGAVIVGGLYWKRGSTLAAWNAMIVGGILGCGGMCIQMFWPRLAPMLREMLPHWQFVIAHPEKFPFDGVRINFFATICAIITYVGVSLWQWLVRNKPAFNMQRMLHRGPYAIQGEHVDADALPVTGLRSLLPGKEYRGTDRILHIGLTVWIGGWCLVFLGITLYYLIFGISDDWWLKFWLFNIILTIILGTATTVWFLIGGIYDMKYLFKALSDTERNTLDDGRVADHHNLADAGAALLNNSAEGKK